MTKISAGRATFGALINLQVYQEAQNISIYLSMPDNEIQTDTIVRHALSVGKQVFVPFLHANTMGVKGEDYGEVAPKRVMDMVRLRDLGDYEGLQRDSWGIPTVETDAIGRKRVLWDDDNVLKISGEGSLDLMLLPGVAFEMERDESKGGKVRRLGHGKGFYDFFLYCYQKGQAGPEARKKLQLYGLALKEQFLSDGKEQRVPVGPHDHLLDGLITGDGEVVDSLATGK